MPPLPSVARKATVQRVKFRAAFAGPSKSGKSIVAIATMDSLLKRLKEQNCLKGNGHFVVIDADPGNADEYGNIYEYYVHELITYSPEAYVEALDLMIKDSFSGIIIDHISHEWEGSGGALDINFHTMQSSQSKNSFMAWGETSERHKAFIDAMAKCPAHLIVTMRTKTAWEQQVNEKGKIQPVKIGLAPIQRKETEYEFSVFGMIDQDHNVKLECRGELSELLGDRVLTPGTNYKNLGEVGTIGDIAGRWIAGTKQSEDLGLASRDQINEIKDLGAKLGWSQEAWKKFLSDLNISSFIQMTPEQFELRKAGMTRELGRRTGLSGQMKQSNSNQNL